MGSVDLKLRISGTPGAYKVTAQLDDENADCDLGPLPDNLREQLEPLQKSILLTTEGLRTRSLGPAQPRLGNSPPPVNAASGGGGILNLVAGADLKNIQEIGSKLFSGTSMACPHVAGVAALWWEALTKARNVTPSGKLVVDKLRATARADVFAPTVQIGDRGAGLVTAPQ